MATNRPMQVISQVLSSHQHQWKSRKTVFLYGAAAVIVSGAVAVSFLCAKRLIRYLRDVRAKKRCKRKIKIVESFNEWQNAEDSLYAECSKFPVLGFDCEWVNKPGVSDAVSVVQLATAGDLCILVRLNKLQRVPDGLKQLLRDRKVLLVGVNCMHDAQKLNHEYGVMVCGCIDLRHLAVRSKCWRDKLKGKLGLQSLASVVLGVELDKSREVTCSNWNADTLSELQVKYAAMDAIAGVEIFKALTVDKLAAVSGDSQGLSNRMQSLCQRIVDVDFNGGRFMKWYTSVAGERNDEPSSSDMFTASDTQPQCIDTNKSTRKRVDQLKPLNSKMLQSVVRKSPLYENCRMLAPDGTILATCDMDKVNWYLSKNLARKVSDDPVTIQILFEPAGKPVGTDGQYYVMEKANECVVCGDTQTSVRKAVIPAKYRKYFPPLLKDHLSHDILCMCITCHRLACYYDQQLCEQLAYECEAPINTLTDTRILEDSRLKEVKSAARALMNHGDKIPAERKRHLSYVITSHYDVTELNDYLLAQASDLEVRVYNPSYTPHAQQVVQHMIDAGHLLQFERRWRQHFLDTMSPRHLPPLWSVEHNVERLRGELRDQQAALRGTHYHGKVRCAGGDHCVDRRCAGAARKLGGGNMGR